MEKSTLEEMLARHQREIAELDLRDASIKALFDLARRQVLELIDLARTQARMLGETPPLASAHDAGANMEVFVMEPTNEQQALKLIQGVATILAQASIHLANNKETCGHAGCMLRMAVSEAMAQLEAVDPGGTREYVKSLVEEAKRRAIGNFQVSGSKLKH